MTDVSMMESPQTTTRQATLVDETTSAMALQERSSPSSPIPTENIMQGTESEKEEGANILRCIASYLSLSDVENLSGGDGLGNRSEHGNNTFGSSLHSIDEWNHASNNGCSNGDSSHPTQKAIEVSSMAHLHSRESMNPCQTTSSSPSTSEVTNGSYAPDADAAAGGGVVVDGRRGTPDNGEESRRSSLYGTSQDRGSWSISGWVNSDESGDNSITPTMPGLVALSPQDEGDDDNHSHGDMASQKEVAMLTSEQATKRQKEEQSIIVFDSSDEEDDEDEEAEERERQIMAQHRRVVQVRLAAAVFAHPQSVRSYCLDAHNAAVRIKEGKGEKHDWRRYEKHSSTCTKPPSPSTALHGHFEFGGLETVEEDERSQKQCQRHQRYLPDHRTIRRNEYRRHRQPKHMRIVRLLAAEVLRNVPLSVLLDLSSVTFGTSIDVSVAAGTVLTRSIHSIISALCTIVNDIWSFVSSFNPLGLLEAMMNQSRSAVGKTGEVLATGLQSAAAGVGSAGNAAIHHFSRNGVVGSAAAAVVHGMSASVGGAGSTIVVSSMSGGMVSGGGTISQMQQQTHQQLGSASLFLTKMGLRRNNSITNVSVNDKVFRRLNRMDHASRVISYSEREGEVLTQHAKKRVQRMMHYHVSLRPFVATVTAPRKKKQHLRQTQRANSFGNHDFPTNNDREFGTAPYHSALDLCDNGDSLENENVLSHALPCPSPSTEASTTDPSPTDSPFMCTPKSFPPTPSSRSVVMERGSRFAENVVFLARDRLRVEEALYSSNAQTRAMAMALKQGSRLAVFNASDAAGGIALTCGQHCATKVGNFLYCSTRSMIPILRNCYVYFEMSVFSTPMVGNSMMLPHASVATLSIGLSTLEMPLNTLVGAWKGSVGLCTTGQILTAGQWCSPLNQQLSSYGNNCTVGCLVCLDDLSAFETWDGEMVTAIATFNVNGNVVMPPGCATQMGGGGVQQEPLGGGFGMSSSATSLFQTPGVGRISHSSNSQSVLHHGQTDETGVMHSPYAPSTLPLLVPREEELFPTLTLHSPGTEVMCRFSAGDVLARSRASIGAPSGVTIYGVDGSVLLEEDEDEIYPSDIDDQGGEDGIDDSLESFTVGDLEDENDEAF